MGPCPQCGEPCPAGARFCPACGAALAVAAPLQREVRKTVTVVFCDGARAAAEQALAVWEAKGALPLVERTRAFLAELAVAV